jgi:DNA-binding response OmpR family regulator
MKKARIWILEDDAEMVPLYRSSFEGAFECEFLGSIAEMESALAAQRTKPDLLIADLRLPDGDFLEYTRSKGGLGYPFVVVSGSDDAEILAASFRAGASDFFAKPAKPAEMRVKIEKHLERARETAVIPSIRFAEWSLDSFAQTLSRSGTAAVVPLTQTEFKLIAFFFRNPERSLHRDEIILALWQGRAFSGKVLDFHLAKAREKICGLSLKIEFNRREGYRLRGQNIGVRAR